MQSPGLPASAPLLKAVEVTKRFGGIAALRNYNLFLPPGELLGLIGPNGAGKTKKLKEFKQFLANRSA